MIYAAATDRSRLSLPHLENLRIESNPVGLQSLHHLISALSFEALSNVIFVFRSTKSIIEYCPILDDLICLPVLDSVQRIAVHIIRYDEPDVLISEDRLRALLPRAASRRPRDVLMPLPHE